MNCPSCGFATPPKASFCGGCGKPVESGAVAEAEAERRQLTVLFCDLAGSTELSQSLDPEDLREVLSGYQRVCAEAVRRHDGYVAQYLGDGVLVYFGYPRAHEDDARRAVSCGLDILSGMRELSRDQRQRLPSNLAVRLGAHTGRVVVGAVGTGGRQETLALGDTPNIAARVQSVASPDTLAVSDVTWRIVEGYFVGVALGDRELKGVSQAMRVWRVVGASGAESRLEGGGELTPFVGREAERRALDELWRTARSGHAQFVTIRGEAGIGKSRLVEAFRQGIESPEVDVLALRCTQYTQNSAFRPMTQLMERRLGFGPSTSPDARLAAVERRARELGLTEADAVPLLASLLGLATDGRYPDLGMSPVRRRSRTLELLVAALTALGSQRPTVLVAEDLHWADQSTLEMLQSLVASAPDVRLLGLFTARPEFAQPWVDGGAATVIDLPRLSGPEVESIVRSAAHGKSLPGEVVRAIVARCDGVPLFAEEVARAVLESGELTEGVASWEGTGKSPTGMIPASVDASLMARIDRLGDARATAQLAATIGREFPESLLRAVSERDAASIDDDLRRMVDAGLAWRTSAGGRDVLVFKHALVRDAAYESLLRSTRQQYHGRVATALRERLPELAADQPELIAHHLTGAGDDEHAVDFWEEAGRRALSRSAMHEAAAHLGHAIECVTRLPQDPRWLERELDLENTRAPVLMTVHGWGASHVRRVCERARDVALQLRRFDKLYPSLWGLWTYYFLRGEMVEATKAAGAVLEMAEASGVPMIRITGRHAMGYSRLYSGAFEEALAEADAGLAHFDMEQERALAGMFQLSSSVCLRTCRATALWMLGRLEESEAEWGRMVQLGAGLGHLPSRAAALAFELHGLLYRRWHSRDVARQAEVGDELSVLCKQEGFFLWHAVAVAYRGAAAAVEGSAERADTLMREGLQLFTQTGSRLTLVPMNVMCAQARCMLGQESQAVRLLDDAQAEADRRDERLFEPEIDRVRGGIQARAGDARAAEASFLRAIDRARAQKARVLELRAALDLHALLAAGGRDLDGRAFVARAVEPFAMTERDPEVTRARSLAVL